MTPLFSRNEKLREVYTTTTLLRHILNQKREFVYIGAIWWPDDYVKNVHLVNKKSAQNPHWKLYGGFHIYFSLKNHIFAVSRGRRLISSILDLLGLVEWYNVKKSNIIARFYLGHRFVPEVLLRWRHPSLHTGPPPYRAPASSRIPKPKLVHFYDFIYHYNIMYVKD